MVTCLPGQFVKAIINRAGRGLNFGIYGLKIDQVALKPHLMPVRKAAPNA
jgi:hypothetical protein